MRTEAELVNIIKDHFKSCGYCVSTEVPMFSKKIDIVCFNSKSNEVTAIEAKLTKWQKALQQALTYRTCSDFSYIAVPKKCHKNIDNKLLKDIGMGLIVADENGIEILLKAKKSKILHSASKKQMIFEIGGDEDVF